ncbi:MAG: hypothetical protein SGARI_004899, partial [Bacillariaceae sp.]
SDIDDTDASLPTISGKLIVTNTIESSEVAILQELVEACTSIALSKSEFETVHMPLNELPPGVTGRVAVIELLSKSSHDDVVNEETLMYWQVMLSQQIDEKLYSELEEEKRIRQPILLSFATTKVPASSYKEMFVSTINEQVEGYGLVDSVLNHHTAKDDSTPTNNAKFTPSLHYEVDGAEVQDNNEDQLLVWDTSTILVFDDLVSTDLRKRMLQVVVGDDDDEDWNDAQDGPNPSRWCEGGLIDLPEDGAESDTTTTDSDIPVSYGLKDEALDEICQDDPVPDAFEEFEKILAVLFEDFVVTRLPEAVLGAEVTPLTANAPCHGQSFNDHIDGDPFFAPPSPWTDVFGRYANRAAGQARFVSCLVYLSDEWNANEWGAPTRFYDVSTETAVDIPSNPGRVVIMDQDVTHSVVAPFQAAGKRPRYSLVWKLILHPKQHNQDMRQLAGSHREWPEASYIG